MSTSIEEILSEATRFEKEYEWLQASELYEQALSMVDEENHFRKGEIQERIGYSLHRNAFQFELKEEFLNGLAKAVEAYNSAQGFYEQMQDDQGSPWIHRCKGFSKYLNHWAATDPSEKLGLLTECHMLKGEALDSFLDSKKIREYCRTYSELAHVTELLFFREWDPQVRRDAIERELSYGEKALKALPELDDPHESARVNIVYARYVEHYSEFIEPPENRELRHHHVDEALRFAEEIGDDLTKGRCNIFMCLRIKSIVSTESHNYLHKALECAEKTRDIYLKAAVLGWIAYGTYWTAFTTEDPDQRIKWADKAMEFYDRSQILFKILSFQRPIAGKNTRPDPGGYAEYYLDRAAWETDLNIKKEFLKKSEKLGLSALKNAETLALPFSIVFVASMLSRTLTSRARLETDLETKRGLLERAREYSEIYLEREAPQALASWNPGIGYIYRGQIKMELALIEQDQNSKIALLEDARSSKQKGLDWCYKLLQAGELGLGPFAILSGYQDGFGTTLTHLYELTNDREHLRKAIDVWLYAIEVAHKVPLFGRISELYWKIAKAHDIMSEYSEAAENFKQASESYLKAVESVPQLKDFYQEYSTYMLAWSEFERAKQSHMEKRYTQAKNHYERVAELHRSTERWNYLAPNYQAWARLDEAEGFSRREQTEEARDLFQQAAKLFVEAQESIRTKLSTIEAEEEKHIAEELITASGVRREYCLGRFALEEARILDRQGDHLASAKEYGQATERFQKVIDAMELESDQRELRPIVYLCQAWQKMMLAEEEMSSSLYSEAATLFNEAREHALDQTTRLLAQAHSSFCKALEAGTRFELTKETEMFSEAKKHIETATSHYLRAGYRSSSDYATATNRLLDGYMYSYNAQTEIDPDRKARFYQMAERLLQDSAGLFLKAKHPEKSDEVRTILENIRGEKEIALSLAQLLHAPTIMQTTSSFSTPTPTHEQAVGLERFENADVQANLITRRREVGVGEDLDLEIELVNAGKAPAQLVKVEDIVIDGFELKSYPDICRVEDSYLDMKGRTLSPLKTQELKLVLKPMAKGAFELKPRILYLDESGKYKSHEPEPVSI
ncbi:MAG: hypothetical protein NWE76_00005, partial [Candidatus Bathyarchaeota archaeon]|nr:hypothetical protein [Candidatus Bathyarchaeota archaeon]